jgi:phage shock protein E
MKKLSFLFCLALIFISACSGQPMANQSAQTVGKIVKTDKGQYTDVSVAELQTMLKNKDFTFVNVHIPFEGNIAGTDVSIPYDTIDQHLNQLPADKNAKIFLYCRSDRMSNIAAKTLVGLGYTNIYNLDGGFTAWEQAGLPIQK